MAGALACFATLAALAIVPREDSGLLCYIGLVLTNVALAIPMLYIVWTY